MRVFNRISDWREARADFAGSSIGFVPTMGSLHEGHRSLLARARAENERVVASIFVNPTQFNDPTDLERYPRTPQADLSLMSGLVDAVLIPAPEEIYPDAFRYRVTEYELSARLEGAHRPGHFDGVLTVVLKLLNIVAPTRAYFGEKDWQQLELVRGMVRALFFPVEIVPCPTVRAPDGLALSSRNQRLSPGGRSRAALFPGKLRASPTAADAANALRDAGFDVDYVQEIKGVRLGAVRLENVRLIDNVRLP